MLGIKRAQALTSGFLALPALASLWLRQLIPAQVDVSSPVVGILGGMPTTHRRPAEAPQDATEAIARHGEAAAEDQLSIRYVHIGLPHVSSAYAMDRTWETLEP